MLHGRATELARVDALIAAAIAGASDAVLVVGEPGIGKTALLREAAERAEAAGACVLRGRGYESERDIPFAGLHMLLAPVLELRDRIPAVQARALGTALALEAPAPHDPFAVPAAVLSLLGVTAEERPVLALVDDAHWLDEGSARAIVFAARRLGSEGVALLLAARPDEPFVGAAEGLERLALDRVDDASARRIVLEAVRDGVPLAAPVADAIAHLAAGNPLALRELPQALTPAQRAGTEPLPASVPAGSTVERAFRRRLDTLSVGARRALTVAAVLESGRLDVCLAALEHLGLAPADLDEGEAAGLLELEGARVRFRHPLLRSLAYAVAPSSDRRAANAALAAAVTEPTARAWHLAAAATGPDEAVAAALDAVARQARERGAPAAAAAAAARAAELSPHEADRVERLLFTARALVDAGRLDEARRRVSAAEAIPAAAARASELRVLRGLVDIRAGFLEAGSEALAAEADRLAASDPVGAARLHLLAGVGGIFVASTAGMTAAAGAAEALASGRDETVARLAGLLRALALIPVGRAREVLPDFEAAERVLLEGDPLPEAAEIITFGANAALWLERYDLAEAVLDRQVSAARAAAAAGRLVFPLAVRAQLATRRGRWSPARADAAEAVRLARETGQVPQVALNLSVLARLEAARGELDEAFAHCEEALRLQDGIAGGQGPLLVYVAGAYGFALLTAERVGEAIEQLERADRMMRVLGGEDPGVFPYPGDLIEALLRAGRAEDAEREVARLEAQAEATGRTWGHAVAARGRGLLAGEDTMREHFQRALEWHTRSEQPFETARTRLAYGERLRRAGQRLEAREALEPAAAAFDELGAAAWAERARTELRSSGRTVRARDGGDEELTPSELQVALRVADGLTNREVGAVLFLSPKTVEHHLSVIYRKLGIRSRTELARRMATDVVPA